MLKVVGKIKEKSNVFRKGWTEVLEAHDQYLGYSVTVEGKNHDLPYYLLILQRDHTEWLKAL